MKDENEKNKNIIIKIIFNKDDEKFKINNWSNNKNNIFLEETFEPSVEITRFQNLLKFFMIISQKRIAKVRMK